MALAFSSVLAVALAALPADDNDDRPVTAEAMRALTDATLAYTSLSGNNISAVWNYQMPNHKASVYTVNSLSCLWDYALNDDTFRDNILQLSDDDIILNTLGNQLIKLDAFDGYLKDTYNLPDKENDVDLAYYELALSPDDNNVAFLAYYGYDKYVLGTFSLKNESSDITAPQEDRLKDIYWADNNHLMAAYTENVYSSNMSMLNNSYLSTDHTHIFCLKPENLSELWNYDFTSNEVNLYSRFFALPKHQS